MPVDQDTLFLDRYFARQRREILDGLLAEQAQRLRRRHGFALLAASLVFALLGSFVVSTPWERGSAFEPLGGFFPTELSTAITEEVDASDPLAPFAAWVPHAAELSPDTELAPELEPWLLEDADTAPGTWLEELSLNDDWPTI